MLSPQALLKGIVARFLPSPLLDGRENEGMLRVGRYGEVKLSEVADNLFGASDEGSLILATNATIDTGLTWVAAQTAFSDTAPNFYIANPESASNPNAKSLEFLGLKLLATAVATAAASVRYAAILDAVPRAFSTDNTQSGTIVNPNGNSSLIVTPTIKGQNSATASVLAASSAAKRIVGLGMLGGLPAVGDEYYILPGHLSGMSAHPGLTAAQATSPRKAVSNMLGPVIIGPGQSLALHIWMPSSSASFNPEYEMLLRAV